MTYPTHYPSGIFSFRFINVIFRSFIQFMDIFLLQFLKTVTMPFFFFFNPQPVILTSEIFADPNMPFIYYAHSAPGALFSLVILRSCNHLWKFFKTWIGSILQGKFALAVLESWMNLRIFQIKFWLRAFQNLQATYIQFSHMPKYWFVIMITQRRHLLLDYNKQYHCSTIVFGNHFLLSRSIFPILFSEVDH